MGLRRAGRRGMRRVPTRVAAALGGVTTDTCTRREERLGTCSSSMETFGISEYTMEDHACSKPRCRVGDSRRRGAGEAGRVRLRVRARTRVRVGTLYRVSSQIEVGKQVVVSGEAISVSSVSFLRKICARMRVHRARLSTRLRPKRYNVHDAECTLGWAAGRGAPIHAAPPARGPSEGTSTRQRASQPLCVRHAHAANDRSAEQPRPFGPCFVAHLFAHAQGQQDTLWTRQKILAPLLLSLMASTHDL